MRVAVVGHIEWVTFARVPSMPRPGEIVHATEVFEQAAGGGGAAARAMRVLNGSCTLFTVLGDDALGEAALADLSAQGIDVRAARRGTTRRAFTHLDAAGERTITVLGDRLEPSASDDLPWGELVGFDACYTAGAHATAVAAARAARVLVSTSRGLTEIRASGVTPDALVGSATDPAEPYVAGALDPEPALIVRTEGSLGGTLTDGSGTRRYAPAMAPERIVDAYGCGDRFAAGLTLALAAGQDADSACASAALQGAGALAVAGAG